MAVSRRDKEPACTFVVESFLRETDDFRTMKQIKEATRLTINQVSASLSSFKKYKAADAIKVGEDLWWFLTPHTDQRSRKLAEKVKEMPGNRKNRKPKKKEEAQQQQPT